MNYKATFYYLVNDVNWHADSPDSIPVSGFFVIGGSSRVIGLSSTSDISLSSEFEQARNYQNLQLSISSPKDAVSLTADLMEIAFKKATFYLSFMVQAYSAKKKIFSLVLLCQNASLKQNPIPQGNNALDLNISIPDASLYHAALNNKRKLVVDQV